MRLLDVRTLELKTFVDNIPPYAILSHCWEDEEVVFSDIAHLEQAKNKKGFAKIEKTCELAVADGLEYAWVDTCCIDKSSSAELSEAINSMFAWYRASGKCYAYLADVEFQGAFPGCASGHEKNTFARSKWFTRAWTLQELLAPLDYLYGRDEGMKAYSLAPRDFSGRVDGMKFYSRDWKLLGNKADIDISRRISKITGIPLEYLRGQSLETASISMRMSWATDRRATRAEDIAYSLLGIFDVNMPLLYGEGKTKAFRRLQEEIMKISEDESIFAWEDAEVMDETIASVFAAGPNNFQGTRDLIPFAPDEPVPPYTSTHRGLRIWQTLFHTRELDQDGRGKLRPLRSPIMIWSDNDIVWGILRCHVVHDFQHFLIIPLRHLSADVYDRDMSTSVSLIPCGSIPPSAFSREIYIRNTHTSIIPTSVRRRWGFLIRSLPAGMDIRQCFPKEAWNKKDNILQGKGNDLGSSSWHASLELDFTTITGPTAGCNTYVSIGCKYEHLAERPQPWCHIEDTIWRKGAASIDMIHKRVSSEPSQHEVRQFYMHNMTRTDLSLKVSITSAKVLSQDMFVVDFQYAEFDPEQFQWDLV